MLGTIGDILIQDPLPAERIGGFYDCFRVVEEQWRLRLGAKKVRSALEKSASRLKFAEPCGMQHIVEQVFKAVAIPKMEGAHVFLIGGDV